MLTGEELYQACLGWTKEQLARTIVNLVDSNLKMVKILETSSVIDAAGNVIATIRHPHEN